MTHDQGENPHDKPASPDTIWAPWRLEYLESITDEPTEETQRSSGNKQQAERPGCFLEDFWQHPESDELNNVLVRTQEGMILLNAYPYANGHLLVALGQGRGRLLEYSTQQRAQLWSLVDLAMDLVERTLEPQGVNVGINQGRAAGAGVPGHLHVHLVPRWGGDVNFISTVGQVRVIPSSLEAMATRYRRTIEAMK